MSQSRQKIQYEPENEQNMSFAIIHWKVNLLTPEPVFQVSGSKTTFPEQITISSLLKGVI